MSNDPALKQFNDKLFNLSKEVDDLNKNIKHLKGSPTPAPSESEIRDLENKIPKLELKKEQLTNDLQKILQEKHLSQDDKYLQFEENIRTCCEEIKQIQDSNQRYQAEIGSLDEVIRGLTEEISRLTHQYHSLQAENEEKTSLVSSKSEFPDKLLDLDNKCSNLQCELNKINGLIENLRSMIIVFENSETLQEDINRFESNNSALEAKSADFRNKISGFQEFSVLVEIFSSNESNIALKEVELRNAIEEKNNLVSEIERLSNENNDLQNKISEHHVTVDQANESENKKLELGGEIIALNGEIFVQEKTLLDLQHHEEKLKHETEKKLKHRSEVESKKELLQTLKDEIEISRNLKKHFKTELHNLKKLSGMLTDHQIHELKEAFDGIDKNGDGTVSTSELGTLTKSMGMDLDDAELEALIKKSDLNGDGTLAFSEICTLVAREIENRKKQAKYIEEFKSFDKDGNGFINRAELRQVVKKLKKKCTEEQIDDLIRRVDQDGDGNINYKEFVKALTE